MSETMNTCRKTKKTEKSFFDGAGTSFTEPSSGRLTLTSGRRLTKFLSNSMEKLRKNDLCSKIESENFNAAYGTYLLRKLQKNLITKDRVNKEENIKKSLVSYKFEMESLLAKYEETIKGVAEVTMLLEVIEEINNNIEIGKNLLQHLKDTDFEVLLESISNCLDQSLCQLHLVGFDKSAIEEAFRNGILGTGSTIDECLKTINTCTKDSKEDISKIANQLLELEKLQAENLKLQERFSTSFEMISKNILETIYKKYTEAVKEAFAKREESWQASYIDEIVLDERDVCRSKLNNQMELDVSDPISPDLASTPQQK